MYRLYRLDGEGKIVTAEWIDAGDDEDAIRQARAFGHSRMFELWELNRMVARGENTGN